MAPLAITELTPCTGLEDGGVYVDVFGTGFDELTTVTSGNQAATGVICYHCRERGVPGEEGGGSRRQSGGR